MVFKFLIVALFVCYASAAEEAAVAPAEATHDLAKPPQERSALEAAPSSKAKSLESKTESDFVTLYRHDQNAGVYRTQSGDLVRMYRVELASGPGAEPNRRSGPGRRATPMTKQRSGAADPNERQRMFGDWFNNYYNPYNNGLGYSYYNYNYGYYPNSYYYNPYYTMGGLGYPYYGYNGLYGMGY